MELTVVLCNDSDRSRPNQTAPRSSLVCSQDCAGYFLFDLKRGLVFYEHVSVDSEEIRRHYKAPPFWVSLQYLFSAQHGIVFFVAGTDVRGWHSFCTSDVLTPCDTLWLRKQWINLVISQRNTWHKSLASVCQILYKWSSKTNSCNQP